MANGTTGFWSDRRVERLKKLLADPQRFSADQIGRALGTSRNSVIGKVARLKLKLPQAGTNPGLARNVRKQRRSRAAPPPAATGQAGGDHSSSRDAACRPSDLSSRASGASPLRSGRGGATAPTAGRPCGPDGPGGGTIGPEAGPIGPVRFVDAIMKHGCCKFPTGGLDQVAGPDMLVCGAAVPDPKAPGMRGSYCAYHYDLSTGEGTRSEQRAERIMMAEAG